MNKVILIRHAESESNIGIVFRHQNIIKITENGIKQANDLLEILDKPDKIICSKYLRTIETAEPMMLKFPEVETHIWIDIHEFKPVNTDKHVGITREIRDSFAKEYWDKIDPIYCDGGDAESFKDFVNRANQSIIKMKNLKGVNYIFSHENFIRCVLILLNEFKEFNNEEKTKDLYERIMKKFTESYKTSEPSIKNTDVFDVSGLLIEY